MSVDIFDISYLFGERSIMRHVDQWVFSYEAYSGIVKHSKTWSY